MNAAEFGVPIYSLGSADRASSTSSARSSGLTQPGMTVVCGDSTPRRTARSGALAFGIGTSEVEHVLATQTLPLKPFRTMAIGRGPAARGRDGQDVILRVIAGIGTGGGQGSSPSTAARPSARCPWRRA